MKRHHRTVDRTVSILEAVAKAGGRGRTLAELSVQLEMPKSSVQDLVYGLAAVGYLLEDGARYTLGPAPYVLTLGANEPLWTVQHDFVVGLADRTESDSYIGVRCGDQAIYFDVSDESELFNYYRLERIRRPLLTTAVGKSMLAQLPDDELRQFCRDRPPGEERAIEDFLLELPDIVAQRYATNRNPTRPGWVAIAAPMWRSSAGAQTTAAILLDETANGRTVEEAAAELLETIDDWRSSHSN